MFQSLGSSLLVSFLASCAVAAVQIPPLRTANKSPEIVPGGYVVELESTGNGATSADFYSNVTSSNIDLTPRMTLDHMLFNGLSFIVAPEHDNASTVEVIQSFSSVKKIWPLRLYTRPSAQVSTSFKPKEVTSASALNKRAPLERRASADVDDYIVHQMGGVDKLREQGYAGEGMFVAIVDTGVDYNHPSLGGGFGPGFKVAYGTDLVGDAYNGTNAPIPDDDPMDCIGHGTHVSGIVGANNDPLGFSGVVPNATLGMWKVFGCYDNVGNDVLIHAFNLAFEAGADVITCSVGGRNGWIEDPWDVAVERIQQAGTPCTIAAGNDGANGAFDSSGAADSIGAISVGSVDSVDTPLAAARGNFILEGSESPFGYLPASLPNGSSSDFGTLSAPLYALEFDTTVIDDGCSALPSTTPDLSGYVVLIRRGTCTFDIKLTNVAAYGATKVLLYNNVDSAIIYPTITVTTVDTAMVTMDQGAAWISSLAAGLNVTIEMLPLADTGVYALQIPNTITGGTMSVFSSWSPTNEMQIKPEVSAPGGNILSTYPISQGSYQVLSGTSMATPYIAGVVALLKQINPSLTPAEITNRLGTTATPLQYNDGGSTYGYLAPVIQQGGGLVNAFAAAHYGSLLNVSKLELNDTAHFTAKHSFTLTNTGSTPVTYTLTNDGAITAYTFFEDMVNIPIPQYFPVDLIEVPGTIRFVPSTEITVAPGAVQTIEAHFTRPQGIEDQRIPQWSGFISINGTNGESLNLPYAGASGNLADLPMFSGSWKVALYDNNFYTEVGENETFVLAGPNSSYVPDRMFEMTFVNAMGCKIVHVDIVPADAHGLPMVLGEQVLGQFPGFPEEYLVRQQGFPVIDVDVWWNGTMANGSYVPPGNYHFLVRALKLFGDPTNSSDYQAVKSVPFNIKYI
ncbi:hypothetical protein BP6252_12493 [Coleophoma cylindrospora]|uniref:Uncharacterized protein n=1 Tax=Coleophoma cylindrospora TaxID=1849047 RepID=A0A3D8QC27_9HELO|nr:hypothetical protein BP6252_12493 [Coleophoma cylindrospora]